MDLDEEFDDLLNDESFEKCLSQIHLMSTQSQYNVHQTASQQPPKFDFPSVPKTISTLLKPPASSFDKVYSQHLTQGGPQIDINRYSASNIFRREIKREKKETPLKNYSRSQMVFGSATVRHQPNKEILPEKKNIRNEPPTSSQTPVVAKKEINEVILAPPSLISERLRRASRPISTLLLNLELYPSINFLFEAINHWENSNGKTTSLTVPLPRNGATNPFHSRQPAWKMELLQRIAFDNGPSKQVLECLHETLQLLFLPGEQYDGYNQMCRKTALTSDQLKYQTALVELRGNIVLLFNYTGYRLRNLPRQLYTHFQQSKIDFLKSFYDCLLWVDGLKRFNDVAFLLDIIINASQTLPTLFGDTLIGQRSLMDGILLPLCTILSKANAPEKEQGLLPMELASQIPDHPSSVFSQQGHKPPPVFVIASILQFLNLLITKCPPACLGWFTCLLEDADLLKLLSSDRLTLQDKLSIVTMLTRMVVSPKVFPLLVKSGNKNSVQCLSALLEWAINNDLALEQLCDLGEGILGNVYKLVVEHPSCFSVVFGYHKDQSPSSSIMFPLVAFIRQVCDAQSSLLFQIYKAESAPLLFPRGTRLQPNPPTQALDSDLANYGRFFRPSGTGASRMLDRSVQLIELFLRILEAANVSDNDLYFSLRTQMWIRVHSHSNFSTLNGMNLFCTLFDLLVRLTGRSTGRVPERMTELDDFIKTSQPCEQDALYLTPLINDMACGILTFLSKNLRRNKGSSDAT